ncbi:MAG TPA: serine/threonine-protein kinase [Ktedonobacteraceae bacterium]|nr:serine/threonine-protein kinase [Ktedonobacteraceae bacterium]
MPDRVGQQFGSYHLVRLLGRGGFAEVYLGQHVRLSSQKAALKILSTQLNDEDIQAFKQEAETIASLIHPHIVRVLDFDINEGLPFLVMDYAPNGSLRQRHQPGEQVPLSTVLSYIRQIAEGLQYAHDHRIIHRDIKPDNMLIGTRDEVVISDFGIATIAHSTISQSTQTAIGTIPYMAPEQMQEHPRPASDQYALAITVYEWLAGIRPFSGTFTEIAVKHVMIPPPSLRAKRPELSPELEQVVFTALAKDPKTRFGSVQAFAKALQEAQYTPLFPSVHIPQSEIATQTILAPTQPAIPFAPASSTPATPFVPAVSALVSSSGLNSREIMINTQNSGSVNCVAWSPDSTRIVSASEDGTVQIWHAGDGKSIFLYPGHADVLDSPVNSVAWSPDDSCIASASDDKTVQVWNVASGERFVTYRKHGARVWCVAWSPDGQWLASASADHTVQIWNAIDGRRVLKYSGHAGPVYSVAWSPNGQWLASASADHTIQVWNATNGRRVFYLARSELVSSVAWSPNGQWLASASDNHTVHLWKATSGAHAFTYQEHANPVESVAWSPDSQWLASASADHTVHLWKAANGTRAFTYQAHQDVVNSVAWSLNGKQIVSASSDGIMQIWQAF